MNNLEQMNVSVVVPIYNTGKYLYECLTSIETQTGLDAFEIILVNDRSTDDCLDIMEEFKAKSELRTNTHIINNESRLGVGRAIDVGFAAASGKYISVVDSDDILAPYSLKSVYDYMEEHLDSDLTWTLYEAMDEDGSNLRLGKRSKAPRPKNQRDVIIQNLIHFVSFHLVTVRSSSYFNDFVPWHRGRNNSAVDYEFILNNMFTQNMQRVDRVCYYYRTKVPNSMSSNKNVQGTMAKIARDKALKKAIDWNFISGEDVIYINEQVRNYTRRKTS